MQSKINNCQNCKQSFMIESEDFAFYDKIKVPPPTFCPDCRRQRRLSFRNTHSLYKRKDSHTDNEILSIYSPDKDLVVYDQKYWWGDTWDVMSYAKDYNFSIPFFQQWKELRDVVPLQSLSNSKAINSEYCNVAEESTDSYLVTASYKAERLMYSDSISSVKDSMDVHVTHRTEFSYEDINCSDSYKLFYSQDSHSCTDSYFLYDCKGCTDCFMSYNLRNKSYCFNNEQLTKEEYKEKISKYNLGNYKDIENLKSQFEIMKKEAIHRYAHIINSYDVTGNNVDHGKNSKECFDITEGPEDSKFMFWGAINLKDCYDTDAAGGGLQTSYDSFDVGVGGNTILFSSVVYYSTRLEYCFNCYGCTDSFGCIGLRNKKYCILNKQYTKEEYFELREKIINHMSEMPYVDRAGLKYEYGEFFPAEISPFAYNETVAQDYFPLSKEEATQRGLIWKEIEEKSYPMSLKGEELPLDIKDVDDSILEKVIECAHAGKCNDRCTTGFKIIPNELLFYRRFGIPLPRLCYWCRHFLRFRKRNPLKLWHRSCMKEGCENTFETSYAPDRREKVYCERCYQQEVI